MHCFAVADCLRILLTVSLLNTPLPFESVKMALWLKLRTASGSLFLPMSNTPMLATDQEDDARQ